MQTGFGASKNKFSPYLIVHTRVSISLGESEITLSGTLNCISYFNSFDTTYNFALTALGINLTLPGDRQQWVFVPSTRNTIYLNEGGPIVLNRRPDGFLNYFPLIRLKRSPPALITGVDTDDYGALLSVSQDGQSVVVGGAGNSTTTSLSTSGIVLPGWWTFDNDSSTWSNVQQTAQCIPYPAIGNYNYIINSEYSGMNLQIYSTSFYSYPIMSYNGKSFSVFSKYNGNAITGVAGTLLRYSRSSYSTSWSLISSILDLGDLFSESSATLARGDYGYPAVNVKLIDNFYKSDSHLFLWARGNMRVSQSGVADTFKYITHIIPYELSNSTWVRSSTIPIYTDKDSALLNYVYVTQSDNNWYLTKNRTVSFDPSGLYTAYYIDILKIKDSSWTVTQTLSPVIETLQNYTYMVGSTTQSASVSSAFGTNGNVNQTWSTVITHDMQYMAVMQADWTNRLGTTRTGTDTLSSYNSYSKLVNLYERHNGVWQYTGKYYTPLAEIGQVNNGYNPVLSGVMNDRVFVTAPWAATTNSPGIILFRQYFTECG